MSPEGLHEPLAHRAWQPRKAAPLTVHDVARVAREKLVATVAREHDRDVLARQLRNHVGRDRGGVEERLAEVASRHARVLQLVVAIFMKAYGEGLDGLAHVSRHEADDRARIYPAREK